MLEDFSKAIEADVGDVEAALGGVAARAGDARAALVEAEAYFLGLVAKALDQPDGFLSIKVRLTVALAEVLVMPQRNPNNRKLSHVQVKKFAREMSEGRWKFNGEAIIISVEGLLNTGQHRCYGVIESGVEIDVVMTFGIARDTQDSLDQGVPVSNAAAIVMNGWSDPNHLNAIGNAIYQYRRIGTLSNARSEKGSRAEVVSTIYANLDCIECLKLMNMKDVDDVGGRTLFGFTLWLISRRNPRDEALEFLRSIARGATGDDPNDPRCQARKRLNRRDPKLKTPAHKVELLLRAWALHREGRTNSKLMAVYGVGPLPQVHGSLADPGEGRPSWEMAA